MIRAAHHDVVEMRDHKIRVMQVNVQAESGEKQARQSADGEQSDNPKRRASAYQTKWPLVERRRPIENFHRGGNRDQER